MKPGFKVVALALSLVLAACGSPSEDAARPAHSKSAPPSGVVTSKTTDRHSTSVAAAVKSAHAGQKMYARCAACHLPTGAGIPGAFPPLDDHIVAFASTDVGREYLVTVVETGLVGAIKVHDQRYNGAMPAQRSALNEEQIAHVLNFVLEELNGQGADPAFRGFTAEEVAAISAKHAKISTAEKLALRDAALQAAAP